MQARLAKARLLASLADKGLEDQSRRGLLDEDDLDMPEIDTGLPSSENN